MGGPSDGDRAAMAVWPQEEVSIYDTVGDHDEEEITRIGRELSPDYRVVRRAIDACERAFAGCACTTRGTRSPPWRSLQVARSAGWQTSSAMRTRS